MVCRRPKRRSQTCRWMTLTKDVTIKLISRNIYTVGENEFFVHTHCVFETERFPKWISRKNVEKREILYHYVDKRYFVKPTL